MRSITVAAAIALIAGGLAACSSSDSSPTAHQGYRDQNGGPTTRGGFHDDWTRAQSDPVCGMRVNPRGAITESYAGQMYYFDSPDCASRFRNNPQAYFPHAEGGREVR